MRVLPSQIHFFDAGRLSHIILHCIDFSTHKNFIASVRFMSVLNKFYRSELLFKFKLVCREIENQISFFEYPINSRIVKCK